MSGRKRTVQIKFRVTEEERTLIEEKMKQIPTRNLEAYLQKTAIEKAHEIGQQLTDAVTRGAA